jgi:hypothetical protein
MERNTADITFKPQVGFGKILFSFQEDDIIKVLGQPDEKFIDTFDENEYSVHLDYEKLGIYTGIYYENGKFDYLSIFSEDIILDDVRFSTLTKSKIISFLKEYHVKNNIKLKYEYQYDKDVNEENYFYENIGLTIWFENNKISNICVAQVIDKEQ